MTATILAFVRYACTATFIILTAPHLGKSELPAHLLACLASLGSFDSEQDGHHGRGGTRGQRRAGPQLPSSITCRARELSRSGQRLVVGCRS